MERAIQNTYLLFLGGYHAADIIAQYPDLHFTVVPNWRSRSVVHTLLSATIQPAPTIVSYADTLFRESLIRQLSENCQADICFVYDSLWRTRYAERDINFPTECIALKTGLPILTLDPLDPEGVEFTGLVKFSPKAISVLQASDASNLGQNIPSMLAYLAKQGLSVQGLDAKGAWAEFDAPSDLARFVLGTKAQTLERLQDRIKHATIGKQVAFTVEDWRQNSAERLKQIQSTFQGLSLVVRSSALSEDCWQHSNAGGYKSILNVDSKNSSDILQAVETVLASYATDLPSEHDQVLVQECIANIQSSGVVFTRSLEAGAPYYRINFDDTTSSTESVTSGHGEALRTIMLYRSEKEQIAQVAPELAQLVAAISELEDLLGFDRLDIEFAIDQSGTMHIFQVRPITVDHSAFEYEHAEFSDALISARSTFSRLQTPSPYLVGDHTFFGIMPDWNPAEIIGIRPKPLAFSLYQTFRLPHLIFHLNKKQISGKHWHL